MGATAERGPEPFDMLRRPAEPEGAALRDTDRARRNQTGERPALVVILSTERSGSTLLSVMLGAHAQILAPPELHLLRYASVAATFRHS